MDTVWTNLYTSDFSVKFYDVNGIKTRCVELGSGEPLIFLHGVGGHLEAYCRNIKAHAEQGFHVYAIDMVGHGFSDKVTEYDLEIPIYVKHLLDFMDAAGIEKAHISGESLGGWVGAWFASEHPDRILKLVLNTAAGLTAYPEVMQRLKTLTTAAVQNPNKESVRKRLEFLMHDPAQVTDELVEIRYSVYKSPGMLEGLDRLLCLQEPEIRQRNLLTQERLNRIKAPTCVIWTSHDPTATSEVGQKFADYIPNSEFHVMDECGHWPQYEDPETFNRIHIQFLKK